MTTPERLKRRQLIQGALIIVMGFALVVNSWYFNNKDSDQRDCLVENFSDLTTALEFRSALTAQEFEIRDRETRASNQETAAAARIWNTYARAAGLLRDNPSAELPSEVQDRLRVDLVAALLDYAEVAEAVQRERQEIERVSRGLAKIREQNPIPPFPSGTCDAQDNPEGEDNALVR